MALRLRNNRRAQLVLAMLAIAVVVAGELRRTRMAAQAAVVGQPGVLAAYGFEEGTGTSASDSTGNSNTGTLASATWAPAGKFGKAVSFNGTSSRVNVADSAVLDLTVGLTLEAWVNPASLTDWHSVIMKETATGLAYALYAHDGARPAAYIHVGSTDIDVTGATSLPLNTWSHLAATYDGSNFRLYVNGSQVGTRAVTGAIATSASPLRIGGNQPWGESFQGAIDEVRIYGRALTVAEIQADMTSPIVSLDSTPPTVSLVSPANGSTGVTPSINLTATFSEA